MSAFSPRTPFPTRHSGRRLCEGKSSELPPAFWQVFVPFYCIGQNSRPAAWRILSDATGGVNNRRPVAGNRSEGWVRFEIWRCGPGGGMHFSTPKNMRTDSSIRTPNVSVFQQAEFAAASPDMVSTSGVRVTRAI